MKNNKTGATALTFAALMLTQQTAPAMARDLCKTVANNQTVLAAVTQRSGGAIQIEKAQGLENVPAYAKPDFQFDAFANVSLYPLGKSGAAALETIEGTAHCQTLVFYDDVSGHNPRKVKSPWLGPSCEGSGGAASIATIGGAPVLIKSRAVDDGESVVRIDAWENHQWAIPCDINVRFATAFAVETAYCNGADCGALSKAALRLTREFRAGTHPFVADASSAASDLMAQAKAPELDKLPTLGTDNFYADFSDKSVMPVVVNGSPMLAVIGGGHFAWREYPGTMVAFWRLKDGKLEAVAGYQIQNGRGKILSIRTKAAKLARRR